MKLGQAFALSYGVTALVAGAAYLVVARPWLVGQQTGRQFEALTRECRLLAAATTTLPDSAATPPSLPDRLVYIERAQTPLADTEGAPLFAVGELPELVAVRAGAAEAKSERYSAALGVRTAYVACRAGDDRVVRIGARLDRVDPVVKVIDLFFAGQVLLLVAAGAVFSRRSARRLEARLDELRRSTEAVLDAAPPTPPPAEEDELGDLSLTIDSLRRRVVEERLGFAGNEARFRSMLDQMQEGLALVQDGRITVANRAYCELLSAAPPIEGLTPLEASRQPALAELLSEATRTRTRQRQVLALAERTLSVEIHPFGAGPEPALVLVVADVSETERLERVRRDFVANASHELRTPVAAILGATETLLGGAADNPAARASFLAILARHANRLERLTRELLDLSRLEHGYRPQIESVRLRPVLQQVMTTLERDAAGKGVTLDLQIRGQLPPVAGEPQGIEQIVFNLLQNAIKYTPSGGQVVLAGEARGPHVAIIVQDSGPGIAPEHYQRLFERFYRVDDSRSREVGGTGIGLSIVKHLCAAYGGTVTVDSVLGSGSTFTVLLPRA